MDFKNLKFFLLLLICAINCHGQNLVLNPGFEEYKECPSWDSNSKSTSNYYTRKNHVQYFNECASTRESLDAEQKHTIKSVSVPANYRGFQYARTGKGYMGMTFYSPEKDIDHCYGDSYTTRLKSPLVANVKYRVSFYVSLASTSQYGIANMGIQFYSDLDHFGTALPSSGWVYYGELYRSGTPIMDTVKWTRVSFDYTADGYEDFITIGSLTKNISCIKKDVKSHYKTGYAYYFVDDFCVSKIKANGTCDCGDEKDDIDQRKLVIQANKNIPLSNIFFESDKSELLPASFTELDELTAYLKKNSSNIEISGYTDNTGTQEKNLSLSEARAKAVADYLISKGIKENRVKYKGYGSANPVTTNYTESGKAKNRRVEFKITESNAGN